MEGRQANLSQVEGIIGRATSVEDIVFALARRGCTDLTSSINPEASSDHALAGGGFCDVFKGELYDGTKIAIKSLRVYGPDVDSQRQKILKHAAKELYHWSKLRHGNVLPLKGLAIFRGHISMVSEWMDNGNLAAFLRLNLDANRICLCMDVCAGLCYIHENGMVHGDLKAANVVVSSHGVAMITDFGNAQLRDVTLKFSNTTSRSAISARWAAPELHESEDNVCQASKEADVYAYGMTALEVLSGKIPYEGLSDIQVIRLVAIKKEHPPRPQVNVLGDDNLWDILVHCWTWNPVERPSITSRLSYARGEQGVQSSRFWGHLAGQPSSGSGLDTVTSLINSSHVPTYSSSRLPPLQFLAEHQTTDSPPSAGLPNLTNYPPLRHQEQRPNVTGYPASIYYHGPALSPLADDFLTRMSVSPLGPPNIGAGFSPLAYVSVGVDGVANAAKRRVDLDEDPNELKLTPPQRSRKARSTSRRDSPSLKKAARNIPTGGPAGSTLAEPRRRNRVHDVRRKASSSAIARDDMRQVQFSLSDSERLVEWYRTRVGSTSSNQSDNRQVMQVLASVLARVTHAARVAQTGIPYTHDDLASLAKQQEVLGTTAQAVADEVRAGPHLDSQGIAIVLVAAAHSVVVGAAKLVVTDRVAQATRNAGDPMVPTQAPISVTEVSVATQSAVAHAVALKGPMATEVEVMITANALIQQQQTATTAEALEATQATHLPNSTGSISLQMGQIADHRSRSMSSLGNPGSSMVPMNVGLVTGLGPGLDGMSVIPPQMHGMAGSVFGGGMQ